MTEKLNPCPKCGKTGIVRNGYIDDWKYTGQVHGGKKHLVAAWGVHCEKCRTHVWGYPSRKSACEAWNAGKTTGGYLSEKGFRKYYNVR